MDVYVGGRLYCTSCPCSVEKEILSDQPAETSLSLSSSDRDLSPTHRLSTHPLAVLYGVLDVPRSLALCDQAFPHRLEVDIVQAVLADETPLVEVGLVRPGRGDGFRDVVVALFPAVCMIA